METIKIFYIFVSGRNESAMHKIRSLIVILIFACQAVIAQTGLIIQGSSPDLHLIHTVVAKENWYSIGRMYNLSPKELAPYNKVSMETPLNIGQLVKIPLTKLNFVQNGLKSEDEIFVPLYHIVQDKEGMFRVSMAHNKVPVNDIKKWNNLTNEQLRPGMKLMVGYLKVKQDQSPLASGGANKIQVPLTTTSTASTSTSKPVEDPKKETAAVVPIAKTEPPVATVSDEIKPTAIASHEGGFFKKQYYSSGKSTTGNAGVFKSTSGWNDGKYYALMNNVPIGTIVRISFSSTNKAVFAKVLGQLPEMKESTGLTVRLSDAAASELGVEMSKFFVDVKY